jgi:hypothetical protein
MARNAAEFVIGGGFGRVVGGQCDRGQTRFPSSGDRPAEPACLANAVGAAVLSALAVTTHETPIIWSSHLLLALGYNAVLFIRPLSVGFLIDAPI